MTLSSAERLIVDGVDLRTLAKYLPKGASGATLSTPARRGENVATAGRHGAVWTPNKSFGEGAFTIPLLVRGVDDDGRVPSGSTPRRELRRRIEELVGLFSKGHALLTVQRVLPDGSMREIAAECTGSITWDVPGAGVTARADFAMKAPDPFWRSSDVQSVVVRPLTPTAVFAGATAPLDDAQYVINGPITNPTITDQMSGATLRYGTTLSSTQALIINAGSWTVAGTGGADTSLERFALAKTGGRLMRLAPHNVNRGYIVQLAGTSTSSATALTINGQAKYLNG